LPWAAFVDFDGTITDVDTFDVFVRHFAGDGPWDEIEGRLDRREITLRDALALEASYVRVTLDEADAVLAGVVRVDPSFAGFVAACEARGIALTVVSSGIEPLIRRALARHGLARLALIANPVRPSPAGWRIDFRDASENGNDKAALIRAASAAGFDTLFVGDGRSDYDAALAADRRFAKRGRYLERYLSERGVAFESFSSFAEVTAALESVPTQA
jgi:HAD superfamily phosphoserine phosphatase-like hydrolase